MLEGRTTLLITHRLSQIRWADKILVMRHGEVVDYGTHDESDGQRCNLYRRIFAQATTLHLTARSRSPIGEASMMGFIMDGLDAEGYDRTYTDRDCSADLAYFRPRSCDAQPCTLMVVLGSVSMRRCRS